ncbi:MAG: Uma2 family endonuclease [Nitrospirae bacterium]|nr:Uma2 family endonuclease [Nitrospirota bacterium]
MLFIKTENMAIVKDCIGGVPDVACEFVSKGSHRKDTATKRDVYECYKVPEYWIVIPELETIEVLTTEDGRYEIFSFVECEGVIRSEVIEGLEVDVKDVFEQ